MVRKDVALAGTGEDGGTNTFASLRPLIAVVAVRPVSRQQSRSRATFTTALAASELGCAALS
jgi:hypothetical protein